MQNIQVYIGTRAEVLIILYINKRPSNSCCSNNQEFPVITFPSEMEMTTKHEIESELF